MLVPCASTTTCPCWPHSDLTGTLLSSSRSPRRPQCGTVLLPLPTSPPPPPSFYFIFFRRRLVFKTLHSTMSPTTPIVPRGDTSADDLLMLFAPFRFCHGKRICRKERSQPRRGASRLRGPSHGKRRMWTRCWTLGRRIPETVKEDASSAIAGNPQPSCRRLSHAGRSRLGIYPVFRVEGQGKAVETKLSFCVYIFVIPCSSPIEEEHVSCERVAGRKDLTLKGVDDLR